ncbi:MAG: TadE/TadG family type IV pilus assembly protein [Chloroflexota bacterium]|nr:TadE/TadG family type IV pilus assembly protein [Chloroflexota bacterium]
MFRWHKKKERGQSMLEFALVLPVLLVVLAGVLDLGRLYFSYVAVTDAAGEGASYAAIHPDNTAEIIARAQDATGGLVEIDEDLIQVYYPEDLDRAIAVDVIYEFTLATPVVGAILPDGVIMLHAVAIELILAGDI